MPHTYIQEAKGIIDALSRDKGLFLEEKPILPGLGKDYVAIVTMKPEDELDLCRDSLIQ